MDFLRNIKTLVNWFTAAFCFLMIAMSNIMAGLFVFSFALLVIHCFVGGLVDEIAFLVFDCGAEFLVASFINCLAFWFIAWVALCLHPSLVRC